MPSIPHFFESDYANVIPASQELYHDIFLYLLPFY